MSAAFFRARPAYPVNKNAGLPAREHFCALGRGQGEVAGEHFTEFPYVPFFPILELGQEGKHSVFICGDCHGPNDRGQQPRSLLQLANTYSRLKLVAADDT